MPTTRTGSMRGAVALGCVLALAGCSTSTTSGLSPSSDAPTSAGAQAPDGQQAAAAQPAQAAVNKSTPPKALTAAELTAVIDGLKSKLQSQLGKPLTLPKQLLSDNPSEVPGLNFSVTPAGCTASAYDNMRPHPTNAAVTAGIGVNDAPTGNNQTGASYLLQISVLPDAAQADSFINQQVDQANQCQDFKFEQSQATEIYSVNSAGQGTVKVLDLSTDADRSFTSTTSDTTSTTVLSKTQTAPAPITNERTRISTIGRVGNVLFVLWGLKIEKTQGSPNPDTVKQVFNMAVHEVFG